MTTMQEYEMLASVSKEEISNAWIDERGVKYSADRKRLLKAPNNLEGEYSVLPKTEVICEGGFYPHVNNLTKVVLPNGLKCIGHGAFEGCGVKEINIPSSVEYIGKDTFKFCLLKQFRFPKSLEYFYGFMSLPADVEECYSDTPEIAIVNGCVIFENKLLRYYGTDSHVVIPNGVTIIGAVAFSDNLKITQVSIPSSTTTIEDSAFNHSSLQCIELPDSIKRIEKWAFNSCHSLKKVSLPNLLEEIQECTFGNCEVLESIVIPRSVKVIGEAAFSGCRSLHTINMLGNPLIVKGAFMGCPGYKE